jgi:hypothetical protein
MAVELQTISQQNLPDFIRTLNESSRDTSLDYNLDVAAFHALWRYWNFTHSLIRYVGEEPAAVVIHSLDPSSQQGFAFYWGAVPKFRRQGIALSLFEASCKNLKDAGYKLLYADSLQERSAERYRDLHFEPQQIILHMQVESPRLPAADASFEIRTIDHHSIAKIVLPENECLHWTQRPAFLSNIATYLQFLGVYADDSLKAYAVVAPRGSKTVLLDLRSPDSCRAAGLELLRYLSRQAPVPITATHVFEPSYAYGLLTDAEFAVTHRCSVLTRQL